MRSQVSRYYSLFADQMDTGTRSGSGSSTGYFIALGGGCHSGTGSVPSGQAQGISNCKPQKTGTYMQESLPTSKIKLRVQCE